MAAPIGDSPNSSRQPLSPTASVSGSNLTGEIDSSIVVQSKFNCSSNNNNIHAQSNEAHFLDSSIWDSIFNEVMLDSHGDLMIASPARISAIVNQNYSAFSDHLQVENNPLLDSSNSTPLGFNFCDNTVFSFDQHNKPHVKQEELADVPSMNKSYTSSKKLNNGVSNSSIYVDCPENTEINCGMHKVPSAPQLGPNNSHVRSRSMTNNTNSLPPMSIAVPNRHGMHGRSASNDNTYGYFTPTSTLSPISPHHYHAHSLSPTSSPLDYSTANVNNNQRTMQQQQQQAYNSPGAMQFHSNLHSLQHLIPNSSSPESPEEVDAQDSGLQLVHLLLACAEAVAREDYLVAHRTLLQLKQVVTPSGDSMQRVASCFTEALHARLMGTGGRSYAALRAYDLASSEEVRYAYQILYQACPYVKFAHFTANQAIFEAFEGEERVHIIDLDIVQGYQWPAFVQALAARPGGAPHLRITGVGMPLDAVQETGKRLAELAESLHVPFEFHAVGERLENVQAHMFQRRIGEALAVNSVNRLHRLFSDPASLGGILSMIREQAPNIVTLVEQEASHNGPFFLGRFLEALHYYSAIFDSLDATLPQSSPERRKVEQLIFASEICNIVACEGSERVERHEKLEKWRKLMESKGFQNVALSANA
ncbi:hypothetical protein KI387_000806, partial [Taxus chinensis]